jgi:hypothetical protein
MFTRNYNMAFAIPPVFVWLFEQITKVSVGITDYQELSTQR